jgi:hypothetical protein
MFTVSLYTFVFCLKSLYIFYILYNKMKIIVKKMSVVSLVICLLVVFVFFWVVSIRFYPHHNYVYMYRVNTNLWQCSFIGPWEFVIFLTIWNSTGPAEPMTHFEWLIFKLWTESLKSDGQQFHQYQSNTSNNWK